MSSSRTGNLLISLAIPYLVELTQRIATGLVHLSESEKKLHGQFFLSRQSEDGGFCGRTESSDLYYTAFALRGLVILGCEEQSQIQKVTDSFVSQVDQLLGEKEKRTTFGVQPG